MVTNDDVAVKDSTWTAGRRGVGVTVLLEKIVGAAAEGGANLAEVKRIAEKVNAQGRSMGMALTSCTVPAAGKPTFDLPDDEMEIGIGIHGEPGRRRWKIASAAEITEMLATPILEDLPFSSGDKVLAFVNGMGGTPLIELYVVYQRAGEDPEGPEHHDRAQPGRQLHHIAGDGWLLDHAAEAGRRADQAMGRAGAYAGIALGT